MQGVYNQHNLRFVNFHLSIILDMNEIEIYFFPILIILFSFVFCIRYFALWLVSKKKLPEVSSWK